ncbi:lipoprotein releasing system transmembrane protein LolC/E [Gluconobacter thailandicus F149-1 = NBRC 100600]|uniref:Lipoprotein releasing system transmembrane protein n=1 Tax=Gluconobacter thailandicus NBRC 3257 TaxID=1381097 RepID=A0ABQ0ISC5_GLUTH|nr:lipoprotein-releasing ABC transporter permease subunit [Gluconobacter thailandicus]KXV53277.1 multidrug ABC transporter substrate-binding protein [Gluconobacter thailandicus]GAC86927.1 lipoprotein releasing system transmembrane protein [Gluconobacter thailandicus NBRC 3255]GAD25118.1 lipoprotein releasing system transmembrane protein [Gluconobacter thailandicus NBRC 3257]GAN91894.1 lipoprotein releasing system transmembrane protein LolC/E [Gluconobacter thailandicus F149-1 = NBRC 100600]GBR
MFGRFERMVAGRYLRARRGERFASIIAVFSLVGIALGVATLIIVMSVMNGFKADLMGRILGLHGDLTVFGYGRPIEAYQNDVEAIRSVPGVKSVIPMAQGTVLVEAGRYSTGAEVQGVAQQDLRDWRALSSGIITGSIDRFTGDDAVAIGTTMADRAGLTVGSPITLLSPDGQATPFGTMPRVKTYHVAAIFDANWNDYNSNIVLVPLPAAQKFLMLGNAVSLIQVSTNDPSNVQSTRQAIAQRLDDPRLRVLDWTQSANGFLDAVTVEQNVMFLILTLIILVAAFNVISSLIMMVKDKTRDIAVLRTLGASRGAIMRIFLMNGAFVGIVGTAAGSALGIAFALNIERIRQWLQSLTGTNLFNPEVYFLERLPAKLVWSQVGEVIAMSLVLSLLATLYPSWRAARTDPIEALRHE